MEVLICLVLLTGLFAIQVKAQENVALKRQASHSSTYPIAGNFAELAVDGNRASCSHTEFESNPWWRVDLLNVYRVSAVTVTNRRDCCAERINGAEIRIGNSMENYGNSNPRCAVISSIPAGQSSMYSCDGMEGRYVSIVIPGDNRLLTLCEVKVLVPSVTTTQSSSTQSSSSSSGPSTFSTPPGATPTHSLDASVRGRTMVLVRERLCWTDALLHCRRNYRDLVSVRDEQEQSEVEELLHQSALTPYVWLGLRRALMANEWFWMNRDSVTYSHWVWGNPLVKEISSPCGAIARGGNFWSNDQRCSEPLNFLCYSSAEDGYKPIYFYSSKSPE